LPGEYNPHKTEKHVHGYYSCVYSTLEVGFALVTNSNYTPRPDTTLIFGQDETAPAWLATAVYITY